MSIQQAPATLNSTGQGWMGASFEWTSVKQKENEDYSRKLKKEMFGRVVELQKTPGTVMEEGEEEDGGRGKKKEEKEEAPCRYISLTSLVALLVLPSRTKENNLRYHADNVTFASSPSDLSVSRSRPD